MCGTIDLQHCAAHSQSKSNKHLGRDNDLFSHGRKAFKEKIARGMSGFHLLPLELQRTSLLTAKWNWKSHRYDFKISMVEQLETKRRKEEIITEKKISNALEDYIDDLYLFEKYNSKHYWRKKVIGLEKYLGLRSESARLAAVRVRYLGDY